MEQLAAGAARLGYPLTPAQLSLFETYRTELMVWNEHTNLTSITDDAEVETRHFLDSLTVVLALDAAEAASPGLRILDVGSGAGCPGVPLRIVLPQARVSLLEATGKKVRFLRHLVTVLGLPDMELLQGRAEDLGRLPPHREAFPLVVSRAVAPLATLVELCLPFCSVGGSFVALKKGDITREIQEACAAIRLLGGDKPRIINVPLSLPGNDRCLVSIRKIAPTSDRYPRRPGIPAKRPL
ncbi:MAG: 16S rRNA (guanine(527)-N(7))-methyltransferase RsmG [Chloroflexi bacterium]|nr:16S rRNA (guanine(527)-N(7))-methyltransferase RsmG [Chloroflexota bacterium]